MNMRLSERALLILRRNPWPIVVPSKNPSRTFFIPDFTTEAKGISMIDILL